jgi:hypothetical protein
MTFRNAFSVIAVSLVFGLLSLQRATAQEAQSFEQPLLQTRAIRQRRSRRVGELVV